MLYQANLLLFSLLPPPPLTCAYPMLFQAKILNFSIAYGKTAHGLAKDFNTSLKEAEETVNKWVAFCVCVWGGMMRGLRSDCARAGQRHQHQGTVNKWVTLTPTGGLKGLTGRVGCNPSAAVPAC